MFEVLILANDKAVDDVGRTFDIYGLEVDKGRMGKVIYKVGHEIYNGVYFPGIRSKAYLMNNGKICLL